MARRMIVSFLVIMSAAACATPAQQQKPPAWTATYAASFDAMANCLSRQERNFAVSPQISQATGVATIGYNPQTAPQAEAQYTVRRTGPGSVEVSWRRFGNIGGLDWLDVEARSRADNCAGAS